jgi:hypothetical protein
VDEVATIMRTTQKLPHLPDIPECTRMSETVSAVAPMKKLAVMSDSHKLKLFTSLFLFSYFHA